MNCKGCGEDKKLIKAHIIPEAFFMGLRFGSDEVPIIISGKSGEHPKRSPIGEYDKNILCHDCEGVFQKLDNYGAQVLLERNFKHIPHNVNGVTNFFRVENIDYLFLKKFFLSVIWRASISERGYFENINLGRYEEIVKEIIFENLKVEIGDFSFFIAKFTGGKGNEKYTILDPHMTRIEGVNYCRVYLFGMAVLIKVDDRKTPQTFKSISMTENETLKMLAIDFENSKEYKALLTTVRNSKI